MEYDAFISYSQTDAAVAAAVQSGLERLARPWYRRTALSIFRDQTRIALDSHLWPTIEHSLAASRYLVAVLSPSSARSSAVTRELSLFRRRAPSSRILLVVVDGELHWDEARRDFDVASSSALNPALVGAFAAEPLYLDLRWWTPTSSDTTASADALVDSRFRRAIGTIAAPIHGVAPDEIDSEDLRQHRMAIRSALVAAVTLFVMLVVAIAGAFAATRSADEADLQRSRAERSRWAAQREEQQSKYSSEVARREKAVAVRSAKRADQNAHTAETNRSLLADTNTKLRDAVGQAVRAEDLAVSELRRARSQAVAQSAAVTSHAVDLQQLLAVAGYRIDHNPESLRTLVESEQSVGAVTAVLPIAVTGTVTDIESTPDRSKWIIADYTGIFIVDRRTGGVRRVDGPGAPIAVLDNDSAVVVDQQVANAKHLVRLDLATGAITAMTTTTYAFDDGVEFDTELAKVGSSDSHLVAVGGYASQSNQEQVDVYRAGTDFALLGSVPLGDAHVRSVAINGAGTEVAVATRTLDGRSSLYESRVGSTMTLKPIAGVPDNLAIARLRFDDQDRLTVITDDSVVGAGPPGVTVIGTDGRSSRLAVPAGSGQRPVLIAGDRNHVGLIDEDARSLRVVDTDNLNQLVGVPIAIPQPAGTTSALDPVASEVIVSDGSGQVWTVDLNGWEPGATESRTVRGKFDTVTDDGLHYSANLGSEIAIRNWKGDAVTTVHRLSGDPAAAVLSPDGSVAAAITTSGAVEVSDPHRRLQPTILPPSLLGAPAQSVLVAQDGRVFIGVASQPSFDDLNFVVWKPIRARVEPSERHAIALVPSPDPQTHAVIRSDVIVMTTGGTSRVIKNNGDYSYGRFSPDGSVAVFVGQGVEAVRVTDGVILGSTPGISSDARPSRVGESAAAKPQLAFSRDGSLVAISAVDGLQLFSVSPFERLGNPVGQAGIGTPAFDPDGNLRGAAWSTDSESTTTLTTLLIGPAEIAARNCWAAQRDLTDAEWQRFIGDDFVRTPICWDLSSPLGGKAGTSIDPRLLDTTEVLGERVSRPSGGVGKSPRAPSPVAPPSAHVTSRSGMRVLLGVLLLGAFLASAALVLMALRRRSVT